MFEYLCTEKCCGCGACAAVCPKDAIIMEPDEKGFVYPHFSSSKCVNCNLCAHVCPSRAHSSSTEFERCAYVCQNKNLNVRQNSTSGGVFTAISDTVLSSGGVVYGAAYDGNLQVVHCRADDQNERNKMCGSKYVQSNIQFVFEHILDDLKDRMVLFSGTPCQVDAVKRYCAKSPNVDRLITCDIVCYGVPSPMVFSSHIKYLEKRYHCRIVDYLHRPSGRGFQWGCDNDLAITDTKKELRETAWINVYRQLFYSGISKRDCCCSCQYTSVERIGDITIADCRQAKSLVSDWDLYDGVSSIIVNSRSGKQLLEKSRAQLNIKRVEIEDIDQPPLHTPCEKSPKRKVFFETLGKSGYKKAVLKVYKKDFALRYYVKKKILKR